jgi:hypothetical protein
MIQENLEIHFRCIEDILNSLRNDISKITEFTVQLISRFNNDDKGIDSSYLKDLSLNLEELEVIVSRLKIFVATYDESIGPGKTDAVDLLIELNNATALINFEISEESVDLFIIGLCEAHEIPDSEELELNEIGGNRQMLATAVSQLTQDLLALGYNGSTIEAELKSRHFISKLAGKPSPLLSFNNLV